MPNFNPQFQRIGDILLHNKAITQENLDKALSEQKNSNEKLGHVLLKLGFVIENDLINDIASLILYSLSLLYFSKLALYLLPINY